MCTDALVGISYAGGHMCMCSLVSVHMDICVPTHLWAFLYYCMDIGYTLEVLDWCLYGSFFNFFMVMYGSFYFLVLMYGIYFIFYQCMEVFKRFITDVWKFFKLFILAYDSFIIFYTIVSKFLDFLCWCIKVFKFCIPMCGSFNTDERKFFLNFGIV